MICTRDSRFRKCGFQPGGPVLLLLALLVLFAAPGLLVAGDSLAGPTGCTSVGWPQCYPAGIAATTLYPALPGETLVQAKTCSCCKGSTCICLDEDVCKEQGDTCQGACRPVRKPKTR
jgi:hypothetical protein